MNMAFMLTTVLDVNNKLALCISEVNTKLAVCV